MDKLRLMNYWNKQVDGRIPHSAQAVLRFTNTAVKNEDATSSCGSGGGCNCGGGCGGECSTSCES